MLRIGAVLLMMTSWAFADDGQKIAQEAKKCWAIVDVDQALQFSAEVDVKIEADGRSFFRITGFTPDDASGEMLSQSALRALDRCSPYSVAPGRYTFTMQFADPFAD